MTSLQVNHSDFSQARKDLDSLGVPWKVITIRPGWYHLLAGAIRQLKEKHPKFNPATEIAQVKEKLGQLVIHLEYDNKDTQFVEDMHNICRFASFESTKTCEICGDFGEIKNLKGLLIAVCPTHEKMRP